MGMIRSARKCLELPSKTDALEDHMLRGFYAAYAADLDPLFDAFKNQVTSWRVGWNIVPVKPSKDTGNSQGHHSGPQSLYL